jgi:hypothetical protein
LLQRVDGERTAYTIFRGRHDVSFGSTPGTTGRKNQRSAREAVSRRAHRALGMTQLTRSRRKRRKSRVQGADADPLRRAIKGDNILVQTYTRNAGPQSAYRSASADEGRPREAGEVEVRGR